MVHKSGLKFDTKIVSNQGRYRTEEDLFTVTMARKGNPSRNALDCEVKIGPIYALLCRTRTVHLLNGPMETTYYI